MDCVPINQLEQELRRELTSPRLGAQFADWQRSEQVLQHFRGPADLLRFLRTRPSGTAEDDVLRALIARAGSDRGAGRLVLLAVLPGLKNIARRSLIAVDEREELWAALLESVWEQICSYSVARRPHRIAANLLLDTMRSALRVMRSARSEHEDATGEPIARPTMGAISDTDVDGLLRRAVRAGAISATEAELVLATRFDGIPLAHIAASTGEPYNRVKVRRQRAERRLLVWLGYRPVPRGPQKRPLSSARVVGAGS